MALFRSASFGIVSVLVLFLAAGSGLPAAGADSLPVFRVSLAGEPKVTGTRPLNPCVAWPLWVEGFNRPGDPTAKTFLINNNYPETGKDFSIVVPLYGKTLLYYPISVSAGSPAPGFTVMANGHKASAKVTWRPQHATPLPLKWKLVEDTSEFVNGDGTKGKCIELTTEKGAIILVLKGDGLRLEYGDRKMLYPAGFAQCKRGSDPVYMEPLDEGKNQTYHALAIHFNWVASKLMVIQTTGRGIMKNPEITIDGKKVF
jgi:hypothetical protein